MNMIFNVTHTLQIAFVSFCLFTLSACGDDGSDLNDTNDAGGTDSQGGTTTGGIGYVCDPVGANPAMGQLLNAPLGSDVQVIIKQPQHPGHPGPTNLP